MRQATAGYRVLGRQWEATAEQQRVLLGVRQRYYELLVFQQQLEQDERVVTLFEDLEKKARDLKDTDKANEADVLLAREAARRRRLELRASQSRHLAAWQELAAYLGQPDLPPLRLKDTLEEGRLRGLDLQTVMAKGLANSPEIQAARAEVYRARTAFARQQAEVHPNVTVRAGAYYDFANEETVGSLRVVLPLPLHDRNQGNILAAEAEIRQACAELDRVQLQIRQRLARLLDRHRRNAAVVEEYQKVVLPDARQAYEIYRKRFAEEESSFSSVESALTNYVDRLREYLESLRELRLAEAELCTIVLTDDSNGQL